METNGGPRGGKRVAGFHKFGGRQECFQRCRDVLNAFGVGVILGHGVKSECAKHVIGMKKARTSKNNA